MPPAGAAAPLRGRREHRKHVTRRELLVAGRRLFGDKGLYESRIEDLSRQAGIAKGTLYGYFANKEELVLAVVSSGLNELLGHVHRRAQGARTHGVVVRRLVEAHLEFFEENPDLMRVLHQVRGLLKFGRPGAPRLRRALEHYLAGLARLMSPGGAAASRATREAAIVLFGAVSGVSSTRASLAGALPREHRSPATVRALTALVVTYERATGPRPRLRATRPLRRSA